MTRNKRPARLTDRQKEIMKKNLIDRTLLIWYNKMKKQIYGRYGIK